MANEKEVVVLTNVYGDVCIRKARRKRQKLLTRELMYDYANNTTLHGLPYVTRTGLTLIEKTFWLITFLLSISLCLYYISQVWFKWQNTPVIVTVSEKQLPVSMVPFPAVTICPQTKCQVYMYNYTAEIQHFKAYSKYNLTHTTNSTLKHRIEKFAALKQICNEFIDDFPYRYPYKYTNFTVIENIFKVAPSPYNVFAICKIRGKEQRCNKLFNKVLTAEGVCYSMNSLAAEEIFRSEQLQKHYKYLFATDTAKGWTMEHGYNDSMSDSDNFTQTSFYYPIPGAENGNSPDLEIIFEEDLSDRDSTCNALNSGYRVYLHHPTDFPQSSLYYYAVLHGQVSSMALSFNALNTSESLKPYDAQIRQCYFPGEKYLKYFKQYTEKNCRSECLSNLTHSTCGCVKFYMPHESEVICTVKMNSCVEKALDKLQYQKCECLPACNTVDYEAEILKTEYNLKQVLDGKHYYTQDLNYSKLDMYFKKPRFLSMRRSELFGTIDFLANCGGILGLFLGFSFLSLVEIFYFLTLRLWCTLKKDLEEEKALNDTEKVENVEKY